MDASRATTNSAPFPFTETEDQEQAIEAVLEDLAKSRSNGSSGLAMGFRKTSGAALGLCGGDGRAQVACCTRNIAGATTLRTFSARFRACL